MNIVAEILNPLMHNVLKWSEVVAYRCTSSRSQMFFKIDLKACNFIEKETPTQVFSCEYCQIIKSSFL